MKIMKLGANQVWIVTFGETIIDIDGTRFFPSRNILVMALLDKGLHVNRQGEVL